MARPKRSPNDEPSEMRAARYATALRVLTMPALAKMEGVSVPTIRYYMLRYGYDVQQLHANRDVELRIAAERGDVEIPRCANCHDVLRQVAPGHTGASFCTRRKDCRNARQRYERRAKQALLGPTIKQKAVRSRNGNAHTR